MPLPCHSNQDAWTALVRTQDLSPPVLTVVDTPPPDFDSFWVTAHLDEPGALYAALVPSSAANQGSATSCPPTFQVRFKAEQGRSNARANVVMHTQWPACLLAQACSSCSMSLVRVYMCVQGPGIGQNSYDVAAALVNANVSWTGLTANTDYLLRLIAVDAVGNCQAGFTDVPIHTLDNIPPNTLAFLVVQIGGTTAGLQVTLDEPGVVYYAIMPQGTACPPAAALFAAATTKPAGAATAGSASVPQGNAPVVANVSALTSETEYAACVIAADMTKLQNKQAAALSKDFRTLDVTPPDVLVTVVPGTDGNFTCDR